MTRRRTQAADAAPRQRVAAIALIIASMTLARPAGAQAPTLVVSPPFTATLSNVAPLSFGMDPASVARALGAPLNYVSGRPGDEVYLAFRSHGGGGFFARSDRLYLQFRKGRLTGFKGDWGGNWMWR